MIPWIRPGSAPDDFPSVDSALKDPDGLLAAGGDLSPQRLLAAYSQGIFPWFSQGEPILWWSPDPRTIFNPDEIHVSRRLKRSKQVRHCTIRIDSSFDQVIRHCAEPRPGQDGTWIIPEMVEAYSRLHRLGFAHSVEVFDNEHLIGGIYGIAIGQVFFGESMFSRQVNASKLALIALGRIGGRYGIKLIDGQVRSEHLSKMGAKSISRSQFCKKIEKLCQESPEMTDQRWQRMIRSVQSAPCFYEHL